MSLHASTSPSLPGRRLRVQPQQHHYAGLEVPTLDPCTLAIIAKMRTMREDLHARFDAVSVRLTAVEQLHQHQHERNNPVDPIATVDDGRRASIAPVHPPPDRNRASAEAVWSPALLEDRFYNPKRLFGVITLDVNRASTFLSGIANFKPAIKVNVPIVSGHSGVNIVPLFCQVAHVFIVSAGEQYEKCVHRIQFGGDELVKVKDGAGTATLSMAYAAAVFSGDLIRALRPERRERTVSSSAHIHVQQSDLLEAAPRPRSVAAPTPELMLEVDAAGCDLLRPNATTTAFVTWLLRLDSCVYHETPSRTSSVIRHIPQLSTRSTILAYRHCPGHAVLHISYVIFLRSPTHRRNYLGPCTRSAARAGRATVG
ncbi:unnamed protein product [Tilletia controversa]|nr:unnamed protein product [Tilletia controversa]